MRLDPDQLEWIVREVVRRLRGPSAHAGASRNEPAASDVHITLTEKLITTTTLESRLQGVTKLTISDRAVVTPSARDLLRQRGIELARM